MRRLAAILAASLLTAPVAAQEDDEAPSLMEEGARLFFRGLMSEMEPALRELEDLAQDMGPAFLEFADQMGPALRDLLAKVDDWSLYDAPELLPNGDIIIRRKPDADPLPEDLPGGTGEEIEL